MNTPPAHKETPGQIPVSGAENVYEANLKKIPDDLFLKAVLSDRAVSGAVGSLIFWGIFNLGAWFYFKQDMVSVLSRIKAPAGTFSTLLYGGAVISICMIFFGLAGIATRTRIIGWLDGLSLLVIGGWNLTHDFFLTAFVKSYGYTLEKQGAFLIILGIVQIIWGVRRLLRFKSAGAMPSGINSREKNNIREKLRRLVQMPASKKSGRLKFSITGGFPFYRSKHFTMWLLPHKAFCLKNGLNEYFEIERKALHRKNSSDLRVVISDSNNITRKLVFEALSFSAFNSWLDIYEPEDSKTKAGPDSAEEEAAEARIYRELAPAEIVIFNDYEKVIKDNDSLRMDDIVAGLAKKHDFDPGYVADAIQKGMTLKKSSSGFKSRISTDRRDDSIVIELNSAEEEVEDIRMIPGLAPAENVIFNDFIKTVKNNSGLKTKDILIKLVKKHDFNLEYVTGAIEKGIRKQKMGHS